MNFGLDNIFITNDDIAEVDVDMWKKIINNSSDDMTTLAKCMELLSLVKNGFKHLMLTDSNGTCTGCL